MARHFDFLKYQIIQICQCQNEFQDLLLKIKLLINQDAMASEIQAEGNENEAAEDLDVKNKTVLQKQASNPPNM